MASTEGTGSPDQRTRIDDKNYVEVTPESLNLSTLVEFVRSEEAGAIATFSGTTRNNFKGGNINITLDVGYHGYVH